MARLRRPVAVALFSAAALTYEVLLVRVFAIEQFHHFAYMAISVAMLGFGASGTLLALGGRLSDADAERLFRWSGIIASLSLVASPILVDRIAFEPVIGITLETIRPLRQSCESKCVETVGEVLLSSMMSISKLCRR